jgi:hypothetical protein
MNHNTTFLKIPGLPDTFYKYILSFSNVKQLSNF